MKIYLREISDQETELDFNQDEKWVLDAVERVDECYENAPRKPKKPRPVQAHFSLRKVDEVVVLSGGVKTHIELICSRCANPFQLMCSPSLSALFCKDPVMAGVGHLEANKPAGHTKGFARHAHDYAADRDIEQGKDLDITYLSEDFIDLAEVLTEQLTLEVPFQPLCKADCKGICTQCGADLNVGRCACAKIQKTTPFSSLKTLVNK